METTEIWGSRIEAILSLQNEKPRDAYRLFINTFAAAMDVKSSQRGAVVGPENLVMLTSLYREFGNC